MVLDLPGLLADHLGQSGGAALHDVLDGGRTIRRGQGYSVRAARLIRAVPTRAATIIRQAVAPAGDLSDAS